MEKMNLVNGVNTKVVAMELNKLSAASEIISKRVKYICLELLKKEDYNFFLEVKKEVTNIYMISILKNIDIIYKRMLNIKSNKIKQNYYILFEKYSYSKAKTIANKLNKLAKKDEIKLENGLEFVMQYINNPNKEFNKKLNSLLNLEEKKAEIFNPARILAGLTPNQKKELMKLLKKEGY